MQLSQNILSQGLSEKEASSLLEKEGPNELPSQKKQGLFQIFLRVLSEPMLLILLLIGSVYVFSGEMQDALVLLLFVFVIIGITFYQENKSEKTLDALRNLSSPRALVLRDGKKRRIPGREVVKGDIVFLEEGDRIPSDAVLLSCLNLYVDESLLTGESIAVRKMPKEEEKENVSPGGEDAPFVYSGSLVISGHGIARTQKIGKETEIGKIGKALGTIKQEPTLLHKEVKKIVKYFSIGGVILCIFVVLLYSVFRESFLEGFLAGLTLGMAILPEEFPVVLLIFLTLGAWRISKRHVLTRRSSAIETLGAATVLCVDKTGTITENAMSLAELSPYKKPSHNLSEENEKRALQQMEYQELLYHGILASQTNPFDPLEKELEKKGEQYLSEEQSVPKEAELVKEYPLTKNMLSLSRVWKFPHQEEYIVSTKGSPEAIIDLCHIEGKEKDILFKQIQMLSEKGLRLLGVAKATLPDKDLPKKQHDISFSFLGFLGFRDPMRPTIPHALKESYGAGIRTIMITGDYPGTAVAIAKNMGLKNPETYITGDVLKTLSQEELREKIRTINIFARIVPEQKLILVNALKEAGEIVAMTGDGVNDAPALKSAHIGIAMGKRGTDVAREASSLVLLDDDFSSIVTAIRLGRRIFNNLRKAMGYILAVHIPIVGMSFLPVLFGFPPIFLPIHIAFLELIIDPACSTVFESEPDEKGSMKKPPRNLSQPLFDRRTITLSIFQGLSMLFVVFLAFVVSFALGKDEFEARSFSFALLVFANLILVVTNISWTRSFWGTLRSKNTILLIFLLGVLGVLLLSLFTPFLQKLFYFAPLSFYELVLAFLLALLSLVWFEVAKRFIGFAKKA